MPEAKTILEWMNAIGAVFWPVAILVVALMFRRPIAEWLRTAESVSVGPFEVKRELSEIAESSRKMLKDTSRLQMLIAESRVIECEVFLSYPLLSETQRVEMQQNLQLLKTEVAKLKETQ